jgi:hypothetical protein
MHDQPDRNDVVVRRKRTRRGIRYVLRTPSSGEQLMFDTGDGAVAHALAFAKFAHLTAWADDGEGGFEVLGSFRPAVAAHPRAAMGSQPIGLAIT